MDTESWTLDELARRAGQALAADAVQAPNGRVRERPDGRAIRWYATIGLVDRPFTGPGRAARYGPRHLLQLVAVKRLQALGSSLAQIQAELTGATDATLRRIARLPADPEALQHDTVSSAGVDSSPAPSRFWATPPAPAGTATPLAVSAPARRSRVAVAAEPEPDDASVVQSESAADAEPAHDGNSAHAGEPVSVRYELALSSTVSLTIPHLPDAADLEAIREAAAPLLHLLADRGLTTVQGVHDEY